MVFLLVLVCQGGGGGVCRSVSGWMVGAGGLVGGGGGWMVMVLPRSVGGCSVVYFCVRWMVSRVAYVGAGVWLIGRRRGGHSSSPPFRFLCLPLWVVLQIGMGMLW